MRRGQTAGGEVGGSADQTIVVSGESYVVRYLFRGKAELFKLTFIVLLLIVGPERPSRPSSSSDTSPRSRTRRGPSGGSARRPSAAGPGWPTAMRPA